jgi:hypothetical protein
MSGNVVVGYTGTGPGGTFTLDYNIETSYWELDDPTYGVSYIYSDGSSPDGYYVYNPPAPDYTAFVTSGACPTPTPTPTITPTSVTPTPTPSVGSLPGDVYVNFYNNNEDSEWNFTMTWDNVEAYYEGTDLNQTGDPTYRLYWDPEAIFIEEVYDEDLGWVDIYQGAWRFSDLSGNSPTGSEDETNPAGTYTAVYFTAIVSLTPFP